MIGLHESFTNEVIEIAVKENAGLEYYKVQDDANENMSSRWAQLVICGRLANVLRIAWPFHWMAASIRNNINMILEAANNRKRIYMDCIYG